MNPTLIPDFFKKLMATPLIHKSEIRPKRGIKVRTIITIPVAPGNVSVETL